MKNQLAGFMLFAVVLGIWCFAPASAAGQSIAAKTAATVAIPDFSGVWQAPYTPDLTKALGHDLPYTPYGMQKFKNVVHADDPASYCLPVGPARGIQAPMPFQIVQNPGLVAILLSISAPTVLSTRMAAATRMTWIPFAGSAIPQESGKGIR